MRQDNAMWGILRRIYHPARRSWWALSTPVTLLQRLATLHGTDKWGRHNYASHYQSHFAHMRGRGLVIIEIGVGGYDIPEEGGNSLRMWRDYFPRGQIYGIDIHDKTPHNGTRIRTFRGSQADSEFLHDVVRQTGAPDIVIDDGSHQSQHVIASFRALFPLLKDGGVYVVEDLQTSYWPEYGGSLDLRSRDTSMGFFKQLCDCVNETEYADLTTARVGFEGLIKSMHFYHNLVFIQKGVICRQVPL